MESVEPRSNQSLAVERQWQNPSVRKRRARAIRRAMGSRAVRRRISEGLRRRWAEKRAAMAEAGNAPQA